MQDAAAMLPAATLQIGQILVLFAQTMMCTDGVQRGPAARSNECNVYALEIFATDSAALFFSHRGI